MPQMMPLNWISLMIFFIIMFMTLNIFLYFNFQIFNNLKSLSYKNNVSPNWKW